MESLDDGIGRQKIQVVVHLRFLEDEASKTWKRKNNFCWNKHKTLALKKDTVNVEQE